MDTISTDKKYEGPNLSINNDKKRDLNVLAAIPSNNNCDYGNVSTVNSDALCLNE